MNDSTQGNLESSDPSPSRDEQLLIDFVLGECDESTAEQVRARLAEDADFSALHTDVANTFGALGMYAAPSPADDLEARTLERVRALRRTEMLLDSQPVGGDDRKPIFSFRELMTLAAAAVVTIAIVLPSFRRAQQLSRRSLCQDKVAQVGAALGHFASGHDGRLPTTSTSEDLWLPQNGQAYASNSAGLFQLVRQRLAGPEMFQCPSTGEQTFAIRAGMTDFPSPKAISYSYQHSLNARLMLHLLDAKMAILADDTPVFVDGRFRPAGLKCEVSENHSDDGQNVLYPDGAVVWTTHSRVGVDQDNIFLAGDISNYTGRERPAHETDSFLLPHPGR